MAIEFIFLQLGIILGFSFPVWSLKLQMFRALTEITEKGTEVDGVLRSLVLQDEGLGVLHKVKTSFKF